MADEDEVIRVGIEGDPSTYISALEKAVVQNKTLLDRFTASYADTTAKVEIAVQRLNQTVQSINKQYGEGASQLPFFSSVTGQYTDEVIRQNNQLNELGARLQSVTATIKEQTQALMTARNELARFNSEQRSTSATEIVKPIPVATAPTPSAQTVPSTPAPVPITTIAPDLSTYEGKLNEVAAIERRRAAEDLLARQEQTLLGIRRELDLETVTSADVQNLYQRALTESRLASSALTAAQKEIGPAAAQGSATAVAAMGMFEEANTQAIEIVTVLKDRLTGLALAHNVVSESASQSAAIQERLVAAQALAARQTETLSSLQKESAESGNVSTSQMEGIHKRAMAEMQLASSALISTQKEIGPAAAAGVSQAVQAIEILSATYAEASAVVSQLKAQLSISNAVTTGTGNEDVAILRQKSVATDLLARQEQSLKSIQDELTASNLTAAEAQTLLQRAMVESRIASAGLGQAQRAIGSSLSEGSVEAIAAMGMFEKASMQAASVVDVLKERVKSLALAQSSASTADEQTAAATERLAAAQGLLSRQAQTLGAIQKEVAESSNLSASQMEGIYKRATAEMSIASSALIAAQKEIGPAAAAGVVEAVKAIEILQTTYSNAANSVAQLKAQLKVASSGTSDEETVSLQQRIAAEQQATQQTARLMAIRQEANAADVDGVALQNLLQRSMAESTTAASALGTAQRELGIAAAQGNANALAGIAAYSGANTTARETVSQLKAQINEYNIAQTGAASSTRVAQISQEQLAAAQALVARQTETLTSLQRELGLSSELTAGQMAGIYRRVSAELTLVTAALNSAQKEIGPAAAAGVGDASLALEVLQAQYATTLEVVQSFSLQLKALTAAEKESAAGADVASIATAQLASAQALAERQAASLNGIQRELDSTTKMSANQLGSVYVRATTEARQASSALAAAQKTIGPAAAAGNQEAILALRILSQNFQDASLYADLLKSQLGMLAEAQGRSATSARSEAEAQELASQAKRVGAVAALEEAGATEKLHYSQIQAFGSSRVLASELGLGGVGSALSRMISQSKVLGPLFETLLPVSLVLAGVDMLKQWGTELKAIEDDYINLTSTMNTVEDVANRMGKAVESSFQHVVENEITHLRYLGKEVDAAEAKRQSLESKPIDMQPFFSDKAVDSQLKQLDEGMRESIKGAFTDMIPHDVPARIGDITNKLKEAEKEAKSARDRQKEAVSAPGDETGGGAFVESQMLERQARQYETAALIYGGAIQYLKQMNTQFKSDTARESDEVSNAKGRRLIKDTEEEIDRMKLTGEYSKEAERAKWQGVLQQLEEGTANYHTVMQKMGSTVSTRTSKTPDHTAQDLKKQDMDELTEMRLHGEEIGAEHSRILAGEEAYVRDRISAEEKYVDNVRWLRRELVTILQEEERERIKQENAKAKTMVTDEGKPDYHAQLEFWNEVLAQTKAGGAEWANAMEQAQHSGAEAIRTGNDEIKKNVETSYNEWITANHRTEVEILHFWENVKKMYAGSAPMVEEAIRRISEATTKLREETVKYNELKERGQAGKDEGELEHKKLETERDYTIHPRISMPFGKSAEQQQKEAIQNLDLQILQRKQTEANKEVEIARQAYGTDSSEYQRALNHKEELDRQYSNHSYQIQTQRIQDQLKEYQKMFNIIENGFNRAIDRLIDGDRKWYQSFGDIIKNVEKEFARMLINIAMQWLESKIIQMVLGPGAQQPGQQGQNSGQQQQLQQTKNTNFQSAESYAGLSAAEEFAYAIAQSAGNIPYAMGQAAIAYGAAQVWAAASQFKEGGIMGGDPNTAIPAVLHGQEMVLPSHLSKGLQTMISGGGAGGGPTTYQSMNVRYTDNSGGGGNPGSNTRDVIQEARRGFKSFNGR